MEIKTSEAEVKRAVKEYLDAKIYLYVFIQNQGQWIAKKEVYAKFSGTRGAPDLMVFISEKRPIQTPGKWICIELKSTSGKQSKDQEVFERILNARGGEYFVVRSIDDLIDALDGD